MVKRKANTDADSLSTTVKDAAETSRIYIALFSESNNIQPLSTYSDIEEDDFTCSFCGLPADLCTCIIITPGGMRCPLCGEIGRAHV